MDENKKILGIRFSNNPSSITLTKPVLKGDDGGFYAPSVDEEGNLNWQPSEEYMPALPSANIKGKPGKDGADGKPGANGKNGIDGKPGANGKTPKKGVDYFTEAEVREVEEFIKKDLQIPEGNGFKEIRSFTVPENPETDKSGINWIMRDEGNIVGFGFDVDNDGKAFEFNDFIILFLGTFKVGSESLTITNKADTTHTPELINYYRSGITKDKYINIFESNTKNEQVCFPSHTAVGQYNSALIQNTALGNASIGFIKSVNYRKFCAYVQLGALDMRGIQIKVYGRKVNSK